MAHDLRDLSDAELIVSLKALVHDERRHLVLVLRHLDEMDRRHLADKQGFPSLFDYCVRELRYAEGEAARRIHAARAAAKYPVLYRALGRGLMSLTTVSMLAPHLRWENYRRVVREALGRNKREVKRIIPGRRAERRARGSQRGAPGATAVGGRGPCRGTAGRRISRGVREEVWRRDGGRCAFVGPDGRRCTVTEGLEYDHIRPWALGGHSDDPKNVRLLCRRHNELEARRVFGDDAIDHAISRKPGKAGETPQVPADQRT